MRFCIRKNESFNLLQYINIFKTPLPTTQKKRPEGRFYQHFKNPFEAC